MVRSLETQTSPYIASILVVHYTRTSGRLWFWNIGRGLRPMRGILVNIELDFPFMITKLPTEFYWSWSLTLWDMVFQKILLEEVCALLGRFLSISNTVWGEVTTRNSRVNPKSLETSTRWAEFSKQTDVRRCWLTRVVHQFMISLYVGYNAGNTNLLIWFNKYSKKKKKPKKITKC